MQSKERNRAIDKVRKLRDRAAGAGSSEAEVEMALKTMGDLMDTFNISLDEVSLAAEECRKVTIEFDDGGTFKFGTVTVAVANFCDCLTYYTERAKEPKRKADGTIITDRASGRVHWHKPTVENHFYGVSQDAETAAYLMELIREAAKSAVDEFKLSEGYDAYLGSKLSLTKSFVDGFAQRMVLRLNRMKKERQAELEAARVAREASGEASLDAERAAQLRREGAGMSLVALKDAKVGDDFEKAHGWRVSYRTSNAGGGNSGLGRQAGHSAADRVNLSRPLGGGAHSGQLKIGKD